MIVRKQLDTVRNLLARHSAVGLLGPRQVGKTTLALEIASESDAFIYLDLESPSDQAKLQEAELYLSDNEDKLIILDEIQRAPGLFQVLRGVIDAGRRKGLKSGRFLILGSASLDLLRQSAESLAGRIAYVELTPFTVLETDHSKNFNQLWNRGGFPDSYLGESDQVSLEWRQAFIKTYLERDVPQLGPRIPAETLRRFWTILAHLQGTTLDASKIAASLGISSVTVSRYLDLMVDLMLVRRLPSWSGNGKKRLVRSPKIYVRDSGLTHALLNIPNLDFLLGHPICGMSWEGYVIENIIAAAAHTNPQAYFYRTSAGAEIDLILEWGIDDRIVIEIKRTSQPQVTKGFYQACEDLKPKLRFYIYSGKERFMLSHQIEAISLIGILEYLQRL